MKLTHLNALKVFKRFEAVFALIRRLAGRRTELTDETGIRRAAARAGDVAFAMQQCALATARLRRRDAVLA